VLKILSLGVVQVESADALKKGLTVTSPAAARAQAAAKKRTEWAKEAALSLAVKSASVAAESKNEENKSHGRTALENLRAQQAEMIRFVSHVVNLFVDL
jgi:hypothetical protein